MDNWNRTTGHIEHNVDLEQIICYRCVSNRNSAIRISIAVVHTNRMLMTFLLSQNKLFIFVSNVTETSVVPASNH